MMIRSAFLILVLFQFSSSYKVLVFNPTFGASHSNFLGKISDILIDAGHDVTMLIPVFMKDKENLVGSKKVTKIIRIEQDPRIAKVMKESRTEEVMRKQSWKSSSNMEMFISMITTFSVTSGYQCENLFSNAGIIEQLKTEKYDLGLSESLFICGHALFDYIGVKSVVNSDSILMMDVVKYAIGEPASASFYPGLITGSWDQNSILDRAKNLAANGVLLWFANTRHQTELEMIEPYYEGMKTRDELLSLITFNMINSNQYLDYPSPVLPKTVFIGGMQVNTKKTGKVKLDQKWEEILNERATTVLVSFGSKTFSSDMPDEYKAAFLKVFESMPGTTFIWKYEIENSTIVDHLPNVYLSKWLPQNDLLADDRLSLFVTHGGLGSIMELAYQGKSAVVIPVMGDQPRNAHMLTRHGGALKLDKTKLNNPSEIKKAIETVLNDENYKKNAKKLAQILESQPNQPKDVVLKHCDFAVKFGPLETLNSSGRHFNVLQYYSIDIVIVLLALLIVELVIIFVIVRATASRVFRFSTKSKKD